MDTHIKRLGVLHQLDEKRDQTFNEMKIILLFASLLLSLCALPSAAQVAPQRTASDDEALLRKWVSTLGSDDFGGRLPMTEYEPKTIKYLAAEMEALGLQPGFGDSWFQKVKTISAVCKPTGGKFRVKGESGTQGC